MQGNTLLIEDNKILAITEGDPDLPDAQIIDAKGHWVAPGFIDLHIHGGGGADFMDGTEEAFWEVARLHARHGTTAMNPTTLSCSKEELIEVVDLYEQVRHRPSPGSEFIGLHLEGPYFAMSQRGAQDPKYIREPDPAEYKALLSRPHSVTRWSSAPELEGAPELGEFLRSRGILPAIAHTEAIYEEVIVAFEKGYSHATHFYSAMSGVTRRGAFRYAGVVESAYLIDEMTVEIIADGKHLPPPLLKLIYKLKGADRTALITDAMRGAGMPPGESLIGSLRNGQKVIIEDGVAKLPDRSAFAGSVATADRLVRNMVQLADVPLTDAVRMMSSTPAAIMGISDRKGSLSPGKDADIVIFDDQITIQYTLVGGKVVYQRIE